MKNAMDLERMPFKSTAVSIEKAQTRHGFYVTQLVGNPFHVSVIAAPSRQLLQLFLFCFLSISGKSFVVRND